MTVNSLNDVASITYDPRTMKLILPVPSQGNIAIVGSNALPVIDLQGNIRKPLVQKEVKVSLELSGGHQDTMIKEYTISVEGQYKDIGDNQKPKVIPALAEWYGLQGTIKIDDSTKVYVKDDLFKETASMFIEDLKAIDVHISLGEVEAANTIVFELDEKNYYGKEGYGLEIVDGKITIFATEHTGAFFATRTLHQLLKLSDTREINNGLVRDYPKYPIRGFMLDVGRKFTKLADLYELIKMMSYYKMNDFQIHLNDNHIFVDDYGDLESAFANAYEGFRLESELEGNGHKLTSADGYYTKYEFRNLIVDAAKYGVTIVPEFDTPGHALSLTKIRPDLIYKGEIVNGKTTIERIAMLDLDNEETIPFIKAMYNEYLAGDQPVFGDVPIHIGSDEYYGDAEVYRKFVDVMLKFIRDEKQKTVRVWGSLSNKSGTTPVTSEKVQMQVWNTDWAEPSEMLAQGFDLINIDDAQVYLVPGATYYQDYLDVKGLFKDYAPNKFNNGVVIDESHPQFLGGAFALWNDQIDTRENGITNYDMFDRIFAALPILAQKTWGSELTGTYDAFEVLSNQVAYAPHSNPRHTVTTVSEALLYYDFSRKLADQSGNGYNLITQNNIQVAEGLIFNGQDSFVETPLQHVGPEATLEIDVLIHSNNQVQVLLETDGFGKIFAVNEEGYVGYQYEDIAYSFDYQLKVNQKANLVFSTALHKTILVVDGQEVPLTADTKKAYNTLVLPLQRIGGVKNTLDGKVTKLNVSVKSK